MIDLGVTRKKTDESPSIPEQDKVRYPSISFSDEHKDKLIEALGKKNVGMNDEFDVVMKVKVTGHSEKQYDKSISLDVLSISKCKADPEEATEPGEDHTVRVKKVVMEKPVSTKERVKKAVSSDY